MTVKMTDNLNGYLAELFSPTRQRFPIGEIVFVKEFFERVWILDTFIYKGKRFYKVQEVEYKIGETPIMEIAQEDLSWSI